MALLDTVFLGNSVLTWAVAGTAALAAYIVLSVARNQLIKRIASMASRTATELDDLLLDLLRVTKFFFLLIVAVYIGATVLELPAGVTQVIGHITVIALLLQAAIWGNHLIAFLIKHVMRKRGERDAASIATVSLLGFVARVALWSIIFLLTLDNLGFNITALLAGLGIGGIAVALAAQNILGDLFASVSIVLDRPFVVGDFIIVDDLLGTVEYIGIKTTRVRSLSGEQLVFSNTDLLNSRIRNYKRMFERRVVFHLGVIYQTPYEKLAGIPDMIRGIIEAQEQTRFDRAHFYKYADSSLDFEVVYYVKNPDYNIYMDINQAIHLGIYQRFEKEGIDFAYPTRTLFIEKS